MRYIVINGMQFKSTQEAADFYHCSASNIRAALALGIFYERIPREICLGDEIENTLPPRNPQKHWKSHPIMVDGVKYNSISEAARAIKCNSDCLKFAIERGQPKYKTYSIEDLKEYD